MTQSKVFSWADVEAAVASIQVSMHQRLYLPDYVVGYREGGAIPAVMLASRLRVPFYHLDKDESNCWMSEDASGGGNGSTDKPSRKRILIVTDYNRYGDDLNWIKRDWVGSVHADPWKDVSHKTTRFAGLLDNKNSDFKLDFSWREVTENSGSEVNPICDTEIVWPWDARAVLARVT